jgi:hypothetical protein
MLFTDTAISTVADLAAYESEVRDVASITGLDLEVKLRLAQTEVGVELLAAGVPGMTPSGAAPPFRLEQVVVSDALRLWHVFHTLSIVYRDAYNRKVNDKYLLKVNEYRALAKWAANLFFNIGVGLVFRPLAMPAVPAVGEVAGGTLPETQYFVRVAWSDDRGGESTPSASLSSAVPAGCLLSVSVVGQAAPEFATGWFPYAGTTADSEQRQVSEALPLSSVWVEPASGLAAGPGVADGQQPDCFRQIARVVQRG